MQLQDPCTKGMHLTEMKIFRYHLYSREYLWNSIPFLSAFVSLYLIANNLCVTENQNENGSSCMHGGVVENPNCFESKAETQVVTKIKVQFF